MSALPEQSSLLHVGKSTPRDDATRSPRFVQAPMRREISTAQAIKGVVIVLLVLYGIGLMATRSA